MKKERFINLKKELDNDLNTNKKVLNRFANFKFFSILLLIVFIIYWISNSNKKLFMSLSIITFIISIVFHFIQIHYAKIDNNLNFKLMALNDYLERFKDKPNLKDAGDEFKTDAYFEADLDVYGKKSLYSYINFAKTPYGRLFTADSLKASISSSDNIKKRQAAASYFSNNLDTTMEILSKSYEYSNKNENVKIKDLEESMKGLDNVYKISIVQIIIGIISLITFALIIILTSLKKIPPYSVAIFVAAMYFIQNFVLANISGLSNDLSAAHHTLYGYQDIVDVISKASFDNETLNLEKEKVSYLSKKSLIEFNIISGLAESRKNLLFQILFDSTIMLSLYVSIFYKKWQKKYKDYFKEALKSIGRIENFISLATIELTKEESVMPVISDIFKFTDIRHPLINENICIPNSFEFNGRNIITGSNMSGKTTFMRSIGTNYILFLAGSMVCATSFYAPLLKLFTSMKVVDDVNNNISTFYGEILRVKGIVEYTKENKPMLVLIDEIFKGTNTHDRIIGAKSAIDKLDRGNIYSIVTTHDPELCQIDNVNNYHFEEHYDSDQIKFDYKIHNGISKTSNAIYLLKLAGIVDNEKGKEN